MEPDPGTLKYKIILILILTLINAFFSAAEMAVVSANKNKIKILVDNGNKKAALLYDLLQEPSNFLSAIQIGITFAGFFASALAATGLTDGLNNLLVNLNIPNSYDISLFIITLLLSYLTLVFGELVPKRVALTNPESIALFSIVPITYISKFFYVFIKILSWSTAFVLKIFRFDSSIINDNMSKEEIKAIIDSTNDDSIINKDMLSSFFTFDDKTAKEVMTPRTDAFIINADTPVNVILESIIEEKYSRIPVYENDIDNILGILYIKDLIIEAYKSGFDNINIRKLLHKAYFIPDTKNINELFHELKAKKKHMAVLIDEYGGFSGIITIEDLIEEIMGDIDDEYDEYDPDILKTGENTYVLKGSTPINEINDTLKLKIPTDSDTISGFLISLLGYFPEETEDLVLNYQNLEFRITSIKEKRIIETLLTVKRGDADEQ
ncbi:hemolysin family protein [Sebaldella sp. S0638]|uniref:hemolysin family protein n=1 Tax=Sebaldella sp. S0638 TaxID=2957809 RepID=UPI00209DA7C6|nr:hemolysin family protein [Sebaldella sp. S0638]MCP1224954.1 hemolysin family protein [Sebaldella sp. S0638]